MMIAIILKPLPLRIISIYAHDCVCTGNHPECIEYSDSSSIVVVQGSDHSMLGKTMLCKLLLGKIWVGECGSLWTLLSHLVT